MASQVIFVTGANRGLGLQLVTDYLKYDNVKVVAASRNPEKADKLQDLKKEYNDKLELVQLDVSDEKSIQAGAQATAKLVDHIDLLINNAGVVPESHPQENLLQMKRSEILRVFDINVAGVAIVTQALWPLIQAAKKLREKEGVFPKVVSISSQMGSISMFPFPSMNSATYRASKAALNVFVKSFSFEFKDDAIFLALSPGWTDTDMGRIGGGQPPLTPEQSSSGMRAVIDKLTPAETGKFFEYDGSENTF